VEKRLSVSEFGHGTQKHSQESHERGGKQMKRTKFTIIPAKTAPGKPTAAAQNSRLRE
jgi:hypothetical protein